MVTDPNSGDENDSVLQMWGVGKEIWSGERGDVFIARERAELDREAVPERVQIVLPREKESAKTKTKTLVQFKK